MTRLEAALRRHAHQLDVQAARTPDGTVRDLLTADRACVTDRIGGLEAAATVSRFGVGGLNEPSGSAAS